MLVTCSEAVTSRFFLWKFYDISKACAHLYFMQCFLLLSWKDKLSREIKIFHAIAVVKLASHVLRQWNHAMIDELPNLIRKQDIWCILHPWIKIETIDQLPLSLCLLHSEVLLWQVPCEFWRLHAFYQGDFRPVWILSFAIVASNTCAFVSENAIDQCAKCMP